jgi:hypothetical protein
MELKMTTGGLPAKPIDNPKHEPDGARREHLLGNCLGQTVAPAFQELRHEAPA